MRGFILERNQTNILNIGSSFVTSVSSVFTEEFIIETALSNVMM
jgi:hypothetical protein